MIVHMQEVCDNNAQELISRLAPPMVERIVSQRLRESVREQGGLIHKDMQAMRSDIAHLRAGKSSPGIHMSSCSPSGQGKGSASLLCCHVAQKQFLCDVAPVSMPLEGSTHSIMA